MDVLTRRQMLTPTAGHFTLPEGLTVDAMLDATQWDRALLEWTVVTVDGVEVPRALWRQAKPRPGRRVLIGLRPAGGGGGDTGKQIMQAVAMIAILVVASYVAGPLGAGAAVGGFLSIGTAAGTALVVGTITLAASLAMTALIRPPSLAKAMTGNASLGNAPEESRIYGVAGARNSAHPYGVVPRVYGRHRYTAPLAAETYVMSAGPSQTAFVLLDFGYGPLQVDDLCIGNTPIGNFPGVRWAIHPDYHAGDPLEFYKNDQASLEVGSSLVQGTDIIRVVPQSGSVINIDFGFPSGLVEFDDRGNAGIRQEVVDVYIAPSSAPTAWAPLLAYPAWALFHGEGGVTTVGERQLGIPPGYWRNSPGPAFITGFASMEKPQVGDRFFYLDREYSITGVYSPPRDGPSGENPEHTEIGLNEVPADIHWLPPTGAIGEDRNHPGAQPTVLRPAGSSANGPLTVALGTYSAAQVEFKGASRVPRTVSVVVQMPFEDDWNVMLRRQTPVSTSSLVANQITWTILRSGRWVAPILPREGHCIVELMVTASEQLSGQIENVNALVTSYLWDWRVGAMQASRNPALAYADVLTGTANPKRLPWSRIDQARIGDWADYCDAEFAAGDPQATCDMVVDFRTTVGELCQSIAAIGRAAPSMRDGLYSVLVEERSRTPVQLFTNRNTRSMTAVRSWVDVPHAVKVRFISELTWEREELFVYDDGYDASTATRFESLDLIGIVRPPQAWREGRYFIAAGRLRRERLTVETDIENLVCARGDLVRVAHEHLLGNAVARIRKIEGGRLTLDADLQGQGWGNPTPVPPPSASFDFAAIGSTPPAGLSFTRASVATRVNYRGYLEEVAANTLRPTYDPALVYNEVPNPWGSGGVAGASFPTGWMTLGASAGLVTTYVGAGVGPNGLPTAIFRMAGTKAGGNYPVGVTISNSEAPPCQVGSVWSSDIGWRVLPGAVIAGTVGFGVGIFECTASNWINGGFTVGTRATGPSDWRRSRNTRTTNQATAVGVRVGWQLSLAGTIDGDIFDFTFEIEFPILNKGSGVYLTDTVPLATLAARKSGMPQYGLLGHRLEEAATNLLLNNATLVTQSVTTTAATYTLSFRGTGSVSLSGTATGTKAGTGANTRVFLTFAATAGTLTLTVTGSVTTAQLELASHPTSNIVTTAAPATRARDDLRLAGATITTMARGSVAMRYATARGGSTTAVLPNTSYALHFGTAAERVALRQPANALPRPSWEITAGGALVAGFNPGTLANDTFYSSAVSWGDGAASASYEGGAAQTDSSAPSPAPALPTTLGINRGSTSAAGVGQVIRSLHVWNGVTLDATQLALASAPGFVPAPPAATALYAQFRTPQGEVLDPVPLVGWLDYDVIQVDPAVAARLAPGDLVSVGTLDKTSSDWLVEVVRPGADLTASVELIEYAPAVMDADTGPIPPYVPASGDGWLVTLAPVSDLIMTSAPYSYDASGIPEIRNRLYWTPPGYPTSHYIIDRITADAVDGPSAGVRVFVGVTTEPTYSDTVDARTLAPGGSTVTYFVIPVSTTGKRGAEAEVGRALYPETTAPPAVEFTSNVLSETTMLSWETPAIPDLDQYQLRFSYKTDAAARDWNQMTVMVEALARNLTSLTVHAQTGTYAIRARDTSGNWGPPTFTVTTVGVLPNVNNVTTLPVKPWAGTHQGTQIVADELLMLPDATGKFPAVAWFFPTGAVTYPAAWLFRLRGRLDAYGKRNGAPVGEDMRDRWDVRIYVSVQKTAPKLNSAWFVPLSHAAPLAGGPGTFVPLAQLAATDVEGRQVNWALRLTSKQADVTPVVRAAWLVVDHAERREFGNDIATGTGGKLITFAASFFAAPSIAVTLNNGQPGDRIVKSATAAALTVEVFTSAGVSVDCKIDWLAQGYGKGIT